MAWCVCLPANAAAQANLQQGAPIALRLDPGHRQTLKGTWLNKKIAKAPRHTNQCRRRAAAVDWSFMNLAGLLLRAVRPAGLIIGVIWCSSEEKAPAEFLNSTRSGLNIQIGQRPRVLTARCLYG